MTPTASSSCTANRSERGTESAHRTPPPDLDRRPGRRRHRAPAGRRRRLRRADRARRAGTHVAARAHGRDRLLRALHPHQLLVRAGRPPAGRVHHEPEGVGLQRRQGRVAEGHRDQPVGLRPGPAGDPPPGRGGGRAGRRPHPRTCRKRRRRQASAPHPVPARPAHHPPPAGPHRGPARGDRGRRAALPGGPLQHPGADHDGRPGDPGRAAAADPARDRGDGGGGQPRHLGHRRRGRGLRAAHAARADGRGRQLRAVAARVHARCGG